MTWKCGTCNKEFDSHRGLATHVGMCGHYPTMEAAAKAAGAKRRRQERSVAVAFVDAEDGDANVDEVSENGYVPDALDKGCDDAAQLDDVAALTAAANADGGEAAAVFAAVDDEAEATVDDDEFGMVDAVD